MSINKLSSFNKNNSVVNLEPMNTREELFTLLDSKKDIIIVSVHDDYLDNVLSYLFSNGYGTDIREGWNSRIFICQNLVSPKDIDGVEVIYNFKVKYHRLRFKRFLDGADNIDEHPIDITNSREINIEKSKNGAILLRLLRSKDEYLYLIESVLNNDNVVEYLSETHSVIKKLSSGEFSFSGDAFEFRGLLSEEIIKEGTLVDTVAIGEILIKYIHSTKRKISKL